VINIVDKQALYECCSERIKNCEIENSKPCSPKNNSYTDFLKEIRSFLEKEYSNPKAIKTYLENSGYQPNYMNRLFKEQYDMTIHQYLTELRLKKASYLLSTTQKSVLEIAMETGFNSLSTFYGAFKKHFRTTPESVRH